MTSPLTSALATKVLGDILEEGAFLFSEPVRPDQPPAPDALEATVEFFGPQQGTVHLRASLPFCDELAAALLGLEEGDTEARESRVAALGEMANIVTGALVARWFGTDHLCRLGIPQVRPAQARPVPPGSLTAALCVSEHHRVDLIVDVAPA